MLDEDVTRQTAPAVCLRPTTPCFHYIWARVMVDEFGCSSFSALHDKLVSVWPISCLYEGSSFARPPGILALLSCSHFTLFNEPGPGSCWVVLSSRVLLNLHAIMVQPFLRGSSVSPEGAWGTDVQGPVLLRHQLQVTQLKRRVPNPHSSAQWLHQACSPGSELDRPALGFPGSYSLPTLHCPWGCFIGRYQAWAPRAHWDTGQCVEHWGCLWSPGPGPPQVARHHWQAPLTSLGVCCPASEPFPALLLPSWCVPSFLSTYFESDPGLVKASLCSEVTSHPEPRDPQKNT